MRRLRRVLIVALTAVALFTISAPSAHAGAVRWGENFYDWCKNGNCDAGYVTGEIYGVEVYSDTTGDTRYFYAKNRTKAEWGVLRLRAYFIRLYGIRPDGSKVLLARRETDALSDNGVLTIQTPAAYTGTAPCDLRAVTTIVTRWKDNTTGTRTRWSDVFTNYMNSNCA